MQREFIRRILVIIVCIVSLQGCKKHMNKAKINELTVTDSVSGIVNKNNVSVTSLKLLFVTDSLRTIDDYKDNISKARKVLDAGDNLTDLAVESLIPINEKEFRFFYQLTYSTEKDDWIFFDKMNSLIVQNSKTDTGNCIIKYSNIAEFADGEYAEGFFDYIADIAYENPDTFCKAYNHLLPVSKDRLSGVYKKVCLGIE